MLKRSEKNIKYFWKEPAKLNIQIPISAKSIRKATIALVLVVFGLTGVSLISSLFNLYLNPWLFAEAAQQVGNEDGNITLLVVGAEKNVPTWYSSSMLFVCSILLGGIALAARDSRYRLQWTGLSIIFLYLSVDEVAMIHEKFNDIVETQFSAGGFLSYGWVVPYGALVLIVVSLYSRFFLHLPSTTRRLFLIAGLTYVGGALGMEMFTAAYDDLYGSKGELAYVLGVHIEELAEMLGVVVYFYALLSYIGLHVEEIRL